VRATSSNIDAVGAYAVRSASGSRLYLLLFNKDVAPRPLTVSLTEGASISGTVALYGFGTKACVTSLGTIIPRGGALTLTLPARSATLAVVCAALTALVVTAFRLRGRAVAWAFFVALGGSMVLGYGFANVPAAPGLNIPLVDMLLVGAFGALVLTGARWPAPRAPFVLAALLFGWATIRLVIDFPTWGFFAWRDYTTYVELSALFVGYWLMERIGLDRWIRALSWVFVAVVVYGLLLFKSSIFSTFNIVVGLQQPVLLLGYVSGVASVSAFFFFALVRPFGRRSPLLAALAIAPVFVFQSRGLYVALPLTVLLLVMIEIAGARTPRLRRIAMASGLTIVAAAVVFAAHPAGRFGKTSPGLVGEQLSTLLGGRGVGAGSLNHRLIWLTATTDRVTAQPYAIFTGLGLGPDLTSGFSTDKILVRKPHDDYLEMFARLGLPALLVFLSLIGVSMRAVAAASRRLPTQRERYFQIWLLANTIVYLFIAATQPLLAYPFGTIPLFAALGAGLCAGRVGTGGSADQSAGR